MIQPRRFCHRDELVTSAPGGRLPDKSAVGSVKAPLVSVGWLVSLYHCISLELDSDDKRHPVNSTTF